MLKRKTLLQILSWLGIVAVWQGLSLSGIINKAFIPSPLDVIKEFGKPSLYQLFLVDASYSLSRMILGIVLGYLLVVIIMYLVFALPAAKDFANQFSNVLKFVPPPVLIPLAILAVGISNSTVVLVVLIASIFLILDFSFTIYQKEISQYSGLFESWRLPRTLQFRHFFLPMSHYLSYRFISTLIIWTLSITIFTEIVTGVSLGFGPRLIQLQQLYQSSTLFALIIGIVLLSYGCERLVVNVLSRYRFDVIKSTCVAVLSVLVILSAVFQTYISVSTYQSTTNSIIISTYAATVNLPLFVYKEKFDTINTSLQITSSGIQTVDNVLANKAAVGGYADIPNVLSGINQNKNLKVISQAEELPTNPILYLISSKDVSKGNYKNLSSAKIGYYPNNPIIQTGLSLTLLIGGADSTSNQYISGNDPTVLSQSFVSNQLDGLLTIEPYVTQIEKQTRLKRVNTNQSLIDGISFSALPLTGLIVNPDKLTSEQIKQFYDGIGQSLSYIKEHTVDGHADAELGAIMQKYALDSDSQIPYFSYGDTLKPANLDLVIALIKQYDTKIGKQLAGLDTNSLYYKP